MKITLAQINFQPDDVEAHLDRLKEIISRERHSDLIVFPELILHGHPSDVKPEGFLYRQVKCHIADASQQVFEHVKKCGARVVLGELKRKDDNYLNLATYVDGHGTKSYAKTHVHWTEGFMPGGRLKVFSTPAGPLGDEHLLRLGLQRGVAGVGPERGPAGGEHLGRAGPLPGALHAPPHAGGGGL